MRVASASRRRSRGLIALAAATALLAGCSGSDDADTGADADPAAASSPAAGSEAAGSAAGSDGAAPAAGGDLETTDLLVGIVPVIDHAAVFVAIEEGYFKEEGLNVTAQPAQGGAAAVPAMISGDMQAAFATYPSFLLAQNSGVGIRIVAEGVQGTEGTAGVYVGKDSDIASIEDLAGKTVAVNTLNNTGDLTIKTLLKEAGVDVESVKFIELAFPDMAGTLESGGVDAVWVVEPFLTGLEDKGAKKIFATYAGPTAEIPVSGVGMTTEFVEQNPNTAAAFQRGLLKANEQIAEDDGASARAILPTFSQTTAEIAEELNAPTWVAGPPSAERLNIWNDLMVDLGALPEPVDLNAMVFTAE